VIRAFLAWPFKFNEPHSMNHRGHGGNEAREFTKNENAIAVYKNRTK
jgi:hypothetical protein